MKSTYRNIQAALPRELWRLLNSTEVPSRNGATKERTAHRITLLRPRERFLAGAARDANPFAQVAETLWVLDGRNDIEFLKPYLSHAQEFSDDGKVWRAGYGPRLRAFEGVYGLGETGAIDQIPEVLRILHADPGSRRAVISLWSPTDDYADSKDIPCTNWIQFLGRDGRLDAHVVMRSNDVMWGWSGINVFEWSVLQEAIAADLGVEVGKLTFFAGSFHLYERHWKKAQRILEGPYLPSPHIGLAALDDVRIATCWPLFADQVHEVLTFENELRVIGTTGAAALDRLQGARRVWLRTLDPWLQECAVLLAVYALVRSDARGAVLQEACLELHGAFRRAALEWLERRGLLSDSSSGGEVGSASRPLRVGGVPTAGETRDAGGALESNLSAEAPVTRGALIELLAHLEAVKSASYGDSWKKYGELLSILPNILRKVDRIEALTAGARATRDESLWDTVGDCAVYAIKYLGWQMEETTQRSAVAFREAAQPLTTAEDALQIFYPYYTQQQCLEGIVGCATTLREVLMTPLGAQNPAPDFQAQRWVRTLGMADAALCWLELAAAQDPTAWARYRDGLLSL